MLKKFIYTLEGRDVCRRKGLCGKVVFVFVFHKLCILFVQGGDAVRGKGLGGEAARIKLFHDPGSASSCKGKEIRHRIKDFQKDCEEKI